MARGTIQAWYLVHKWTSLVCTAFLLMLCVTGLPLIFAEEIGHLSGAEPELTAPAPGAVPANLDSLIAKAKAEYPGEMPLFLGWYPDEPIVYVNLGPSEATPPSGMLTPLFVASSGVLVPAPQFTEGVPYWIPRLHPDMLAGLHGQLFHGVLEIG